MMTVSLPKDTGMKNKELKKIEKIGRTQNVQLEKTQKS
jgi:hypothetical protein